MPATTWSGNTRSANRRQAYSGADGDGNLTIDSADYDVWRAHFGQTAPGSGSGQTLSAAVPEPATVWLLAISAAFVCHCLRRTR